MAAGLGTRMRSDVPKHLHPILGRRMVDWVLESRGCSAPTRSSWSLHRRPPDAFDGAGGRRAGGAARHGRCRSLRPRRARGPSGRACSCLSGDTPLLTTAAPARARRRTHQRDGACRDRALVRAGRPEGSTGASLRAADGGLAAIVEASRCDRLSSARCARSTRPSTCSGQIACGRCSTGSRPHNAQGELYPDGLGRDPRRGRASVSRCTSGERSLWRPRV